MRSRGVVRSRGRSLGDRSRGQGLGSAAQSQPSAASLPVRLALASVGGTGFTGAQPRELGQGKGRKAQQVKGKVQGQASEKRKDRSPGGPRKESRSKSRGRARVVKCLDCGEMGHYADDTDHPAAREYPKRGGAAGERR